MVTRFAPSLRRYRAWYTIALLLLGFRGARLAAQGPGTGSTPEESVAVTVGGRRWRCSRRACNSAATGVTPRERLQLAAIRGARALLSLRRPSARADLSRLACHHRVTTYMEVANVSSR
jgi:hypothetical protein